MKLRIAGFCIAMLLLLAGPAFAQWQPVYQQELGYDFNAVHFPTSTVGYIVGSGGVIYKSTDAGATWVQQTSPTTNSLSEVFFRDALNGFAVGVGGTIIYTTDGVNWLVHAQSGVITTSTLEAVTFVGLNGWIGGGLDNTTCEIYSTADGGVNWANTVVTNPSTDKCTDISFSTATRGYVSLDGQGLMYTTNGGVDWTLSTVNLGTYSYTRSDIECVQAIDATRAVASGWGSSIGPQPTIILYSSDGGATFSSPDPLNYSWNTYTYGYDFTVFGNGEIMLVGGGSSSAAINVHSPDGSNWTRYNPFYGDDLNHVCAIPTTTRAVAVGDAGLIALTNDRGVTWTYNFDPGSAFQGVGDFADAGAEKMYASLTGSALLFFDVLGGTHKYMMASPQNWGPSSCVDIDYVINPELPPAGSWGAAYNDVIYISGSNKYLIKSTDYGLTWTQLSHSVSNFEGMLAMYWFHPDTGYVVGHLFSGTSTREETIWKTTDGGQNLTVALTATIPGTSSKQWNDIDFSPLNRNIGSVVGDDNYIFYTTDGGANWFTATENIATSTLDLEDVVYINNTTAFAVGDGGTLVKTTDGGASWLVQTVPWGTVNLIDIEAAAPHRLWVAGADQLLYYSTDGGANWTNANVTGMPATYDVMAVAYQGSAGLLWAGCHYANVFNRNDAVAGIETPKSLPFILNQNFPNPFNPSTTIEFSLAFDDHVTLNVYDAAGKLVASVMDRDLKAGDYSVAFRADGLATGVYFYRLSTSRGVETRKMVLLR